MPTPEMEDSDRITPWGQAAFMTHFALLNTTLHPAPAQQLFIMTINS